MPGLSSPRIRRLRYVATSASALLVGSLIPFPGWFKHDTGPTGPDKALHALGHAVFAVALLDVLENDTAVRSSIFAILVSTGFGVGIEFLQEGVSGREFEMGDVVAGLLGSVAGIVAIHRR